MCLDPDVRALCGNDVTKGFAERVAELCTKLLLDSYGIPCEAAYPECAGWHDYMYERNPGKPMFDAMIEEIRLGTYTDFQAACLDVLRRFQ
jgi:hypothetical protein